MQQEKIDRAVEIMDRNIKCYQMIMSEKNGRIIQELEVFKDAISNNQMTFQYSKSLLYNETFEILKEAGIEIDGDGKGTIYLYPID